MGRGKFKGKSTGRRQFSTQEEMVAGSSAHPRTFRLEVVEDVEEEEQSEEESEKRKGTQGIIEIENPNLVKPKTLKAKNIDVSFRLPSFPFRPEIEKQKAHERYMKMQEQGKTEQAKKDQGKGFPVILNSACSAQLRVGRIQEF
ncbi:hypothetical protein QQ045_011970 [Rhodiola kirilowii]